MNTPNVISCLALLCVALTSCGRNNAADSPSVFACRVIYEDTVIETPQGEALTVELAESEGGSALKLLRALKPSLKIGLSPSGEPNLKPKLYVMGILTKELSKPPVAESTSSVPWKPCPIFRLQGWFVTVPYMEYPQVPEYEPQPGPRERSALEASDFEPPIDPVLIHHDPKRNLFWLGTEPPAELPQHPEP